MSDYNITALNEDLGGNLWLATTSSGAMKLTHDGFTMFGRQDGIEAVNAIFEDEPVACASRAACWRHPDQRV